MGPQSYLLRAYEELWEKELTDEMENILKLVLTVYCSCTILTDWLTDWLTYYLSACMCFWLADRQTDRQNWTEVKLNIILEFHQENCLHENQARNYNILLENLYNYDIIYTESI